MITKTAYKLFGFSEEAYKRLPHPKRQWDNYDYIVKDNTLVGTANYNTHPDMPSPYMISIDKNFKGDRNAAFKMIQQRMKEKYGTNNQKMDHRLVPKS
jgi:hypothetical protein